VHCYLNPKIIEEKAELVSELRCALGRRSPRSVQVNGMPNHHSGGPFFFDQESKVSQQFF
jgi:hypothetical protein